MKKVFLDTNILMDAVEFREHGEEANTLLDMSRANIIRCCAATMSFATMSYLLRHHTKEEIHQIFENLTNAVEIVSVSTKSFDDAMAFGPVKDFEDLLQYQCALSAGCDVIITNNKHDFQEFCALPVLTAEEFLHEI